MYLFTKTQERELEHIQELEARFYGLERKKFMAVTYQYAEMNNIPRRFNHETKMAGSFSFRKILSFRIPEKFSLARACAFNRAQASLSFENSAANKLPKVFAKNAFPRLYPLNGDSLSQQYSV